MFLILSTFLLVKYPYCAEGDLKGLRDSVRQVENEINNLRQDRRTKVHHSM
jgi:hypothetical protein